jgi:hypothetical protein
MTDMVEAGPRDGTSVPMPAGVVVRPRVATATAVQVACVLIALGASVWAWVSQHSCASCGASATLLGGFELAPVGCAYYGVLVLFAGAALFTGKRLALSLLGIGLLVAGAIHAVLLVLLLKNGVLCPPCLVTGGAALAGAVGTLVLTPSLRRAALILVPAAALVTFGAARWARNTAPDPVREGRRAAALVLSEKVNVPTGAARMVLFVKDGCSHCAQFRGDVVNPLVKELGAGLQIEERAAWRGMMTPTTVVMGREAFLFVGAKPLADVRKAVEISAGKAGSDAAPASAVRISQ